MADETPAQRDERLETVVQLVLDNWDTLGVVEGDGGILYLPSSIRWRNPKGGIAEDKVFLRQVTNQHRWKARTRSRQWATKVGLDLDRDADLVEDLERAELLAFAVRDEQFVQHIPDGETLAKLYEPGSLEELYSRWEAWTRMVHPSFGEWNAEDMWQVIARVRAGSTITPLAVMPGRAQANLLLFMAREAALSPNAPSWLRSSETSTPAR